MSRLTRTFWSLHSRGWDALRSSASPHIEEVVSVLAGELPAAAEVLDLGCGAGHHSEALASRGFRVTGLDYSPGMLDLARRRVPSGRFLEADLDRPLPVPASSFDGALCVCVVQVLRSPSDLFARVRSALRPGGVFAVEVPFTTRVVHRSAPGLSAWDRALLVLKRTIAGVPGLVRRYSPAQVSSMLSDAGFEVVLSKEFDTTFVFVARA